MGIKSSVSISVHPWFYSINHSSPCKILEEQAIWGQTVCRIWLPNQDAVVKILRSALRPLSPKLQSEIEANRIADISADAKVVEENGWRNELEMAKQIVPEIRPLLMRIFKGDYS